MGWARPEVPGRSIILGSSVSVRRVRFAADIVPEVENQDSGSFEVSWNFFEFPVSLRWFVDRNIGQACSVEDAEHERTRPGWGTGFSETREPRKKNDIDHAKLMPPRDQDVPKLDHPVAHRNIVPPPAPFSDEILRLDKSADSLMTPDALVPLLRSNYAPGPAETALVHETLQTKAAELSALDAEISALQSKLLRTQSSRVHLAWEMSLYNSFLAPVRWLPPEIIREIFLYFAPSMNTNYLVELPWKLGHICRLWRTVALSIGQLWSVLDLRQSIRLLSRSRCTSPRLLRGDEDIDEEEFTRASPAFWTRIECEEAYEIETSLDLIRTCVQRSGQHLLSIRLDAKYGSGYSSFIDMLLNHSARWGHLEIAAAASALLHHIWDSGHSFDHVQRLGISHRGAEYGQFNFLRRRLPNLVDLSLSETSVYGGDGWGQLVRYREHICSWDLGARMATYRQFVNLAVLWLTLDTHDQPITWQDISLPALRFATFYFPNPRSAMDGLCFFDMPLLEAFCVYCPWGSHAPLAIPRSSTRLKTFRAFISEFLCSSDVEPILASFPDLIEITLDAPDLISDGILCTLTPHRDLPVSAPKLEIIRLSNRAIRNNVCKLETLLAMLRARFNPTVKEISRLRTFEFHPHESANDKFVASSLIALRQQTGWDIKAGEECIMPQADDLYRSNVRGTV